MTAPSHLSARDEFWDEVAVADVGEPPLRSPQRRLQFGDPRVARDGGGRDAGGDQGAVAMLRDGRHGVALFFHVIEQYGDVPN